MREVVISIPKWEAEQNLEIDVRINGKKKKLSYRVEIVTWDEQTPTSPEKVEVLKQRIEGYDKDWELVQIGAPNHDKIPVMFRKKLKENE